MDPNSVFKELDNDQPAPGMSKIALIYGFIYAIVMNGATAAFISSSGNFGEKINQWLGIPLMIVAIILVQLAYRKACGGFMTYGKGLGIAVLMMFFASIVVGVFTYFLYSTNPAILEQIRLIQEEALVNQGMSEEEIEFSLSFTEKLQTPAFYAFAALFSYTFMGLVVGAITAIFTKRQSPQTIFE
ncbi:MAG TPA: hypothetical protein DCY35_07520 [Prolixibacteraceae bacterium]|nr:hypothetical protein [Prolixibacteraceae bacterium]